ncbi:HlyD family efflux transporter periplasmic adaptor subunit [Methylicorpusculum oleiharenae]|uniref:HlyD family efflux transporter periplasmic adaptor subunit n=1 Tax=Methylicorpusculum oleiharenae TaxID=1338687 RepID=UPI00135C3DD5|nr:HlyD family efflux transporter periplasmic adaptor subunit [Methylicorpusculum oleiharenae]MCD2452318.1 HlyD family efflux transporter periplasmic adaptor subunit [Methylicorpusculum oleiharenae]
MDINQQSQSKELRNEARLPVEPGCTVIIHCDDHEVIGTIENKSGSGLQVRVAEASKSHLEKSNFLTMTYSMPFGLVSQRAQVCWIKAGQGGGLLSGVAFLESDTDFQTNYQKLWKQFNEATRLETAAGYWLRLQCAMLSGVTRGVVILGKPESGSFVPISFWPEGQRGCLGLTDAAELALHERRGVLRNQGQRDPGLNIPVCHIGFPLMLSEQLYGVVAFEIVARSEPLMRASMRHLQWGISWLELFIRREEGKKYTPENQQLVTVLELITASLEHEKFQASATSVATELATLLKCDRVSIGFLKGKFIQVNALSHSVDFAKKSSLIQSIGLAMDEALEQMASVVYPSLDENSVQISRCHEKLLRDQGSGSVCTIPFCSAGEVFGALTLERPPGSSFERHTVELCETIASLVGPILETKRKEDLWLGQKVWVSIKRVYGQLVGPAHGGLKLGAVIALGTLLFCLFATGDYRISADTQLEGAIQRVVVTPFDSYIKEAYVRPGDLVKKDTLLAKLDDTDLILERTKWESQKEQYLKEYRDALGQSERSKISVLNAQIGQVQAQLAITEAQLARVQLKAPFDGVIVSGDLSQSLGAPSQRGDILFEIAPLEDYRVVLKVDERDITDIVVAQKGELVLTGLSEKVIPFVVNKITPVSETQEGRNYFRVEAQLENKLDFLRPGMEGVGKIRIGERKIIWIWTKNLLDWLRLSLWTWWPEGL